MYDQMFEYFYLVNSRAQWGRKKPFWGMLRDTSGTKKIKMPSVAPCPGVRESVYYAKNGGKKGFFIKNSKFTNS